MYPTDGYLLGREDNKFVVSEESSLGIWEPRYQICGVPLQANDLAVTQLKNLRLSIPLALLVQRINVLRGQSWFLFTNEQKIRMLWNWK